MKLSKKFGTLDSQFAKFDDKPVDLTVHPPLETQIVSKAVQFPCYRCGKNVIAGYQNKEPAIFHESPVCLTYQSIESANEVNDFIKSCRLAIS